jgi:hypothetical protein
MMKSYVVRERLFALVGAASLVALAACEDKRVSKLDTGITRDSAVSVLATQIRPGSGSDSFPNVYMREKFLVGGKPLEVLYFTPNNEKVTKDTVPMKQLTPLVFVDNRMVGKGWKAWDSIAKANSIPVKKR